PAEGAPAEPFEERDVRRLYERLHIPSALGCCPSDGEPHERCAQTMVAVPRQNREPVAFPPGRLAGERVEPDRAAHDPLGKADYRDRRRVLVMGIPVPAADPAEQALLNDEDLMPDQEMRRELFRRGGAAASQLGTFRLEVSRSAAAGRLANRC